MLHLNRDIQDDLSVCLARADLHFSCAAYAEARAPLVISCIEPLAKGLISPGSRLEE